MLLTALHRLPDLEILAVVVVVITALSALAPWVAHAAGLRADEKREEAVFEGYKAVMGIIGVVLAFSLVQANTNLQTIQEMVGKEATAIAAVDRVLLRSGQPALAAFRPGLADFGNKIVQLEWPSLAESERSPEADAAYTLISRGVRSFVPTDARQQTVYAELLKQMDDLSELREQVIQASDIALPSFFWVTGGALLVVSLMLAAFTSLSLRQQVGVAASAAAVAILLTFVIIVDRPFEGETSISPKPVQKALERNARRADLWPLPDPIGRHLA